MVPLQDDQGSIDRRGGDVLTGTLVLLAHVAPWSPPPTTQATDRGDRGPAPTRVADGTHSCAYVHHTHCYPVGVNAAAAVRTARSLSGLSRRQLGLMAGVAPSTVQRIELGQVDPTVGMLQRVLTVAGFALPDDLVPVSDPAAVAAARSVLDARWGLSGTPGVEQWLGRWETIGLVEQQEGGRFTTKRPRQFAEQAGLVSRLSRRPGIGTFTSGGRAWRALAERLRDGDVPWVATGAEAANRIAFSASATWPVFYVTDVRRGAELLDVGRPEVGSGLVSLIPFDGVADVGVLADTDGMRWADPLQVLVDCYGGEDRMPEQADVLAEVLLPEESTDAIER